MKDFCASKNQGLRKLFVWCKLYIERDVKVE